MHPQQGSPHVFITGVAGFIGLALAKSLLQDGWKVSGLDNFSYGNKEEIDTLSNHSNFRFFEGDLETFQMSQDLRPDAIVHLASLKIPRYGNALSTLQRNAAGLNQAISMSLACDALLLFASTSDVYGLSTDLPFREDSPTPIGNPAVPRWAYAISKLHAEHLIHAFAAEKGLRFTIARLFGTYGPGQRYDWWGGPQGLFLHLAAEKKPLEIHGDGLQTRCFIYIDDAVDALKLLLKSHNSRGQIFNIGAFPDEEISIVDLARLIWGCMNPGEMAQLQHVPYSKFGQYEDVSRRVPDLTRISSLGFSPKVRLREGIERLKAHYLSGR